MIAFIQSISVTTSEKEETKDLFVVIGDSIAFGTSNGVGDSDFMYEFEGNNIVKTREVLNANTGSWMPSFANNWKGLTGNDVIFSTNGSPGSEFSPNGDTKNWSTSGFLYGDLQTEIQNIETAGFAIKGFIIVLGINDARGNASITQIETDAQSLINRLNSDYTTPKIYAVQIGREESGVTTRVSDVRNIISNGTDGLVETYNNVYLAESLADNPDTDFYDNLHLTQQANDELGVGISNFAFSN